MILYFSGTGNSKYVAQRIADALGDTLFNMNDRIKARDSSPIETGERIVFVTPTYAWRIPRIVQDWLLKTDLIGAKRAWFVMTCGSEIGNANKYNQALCETKHLAYMGTAEIVMPENYIAMFNAPQPDEARKIVVNAEPSIECAIAAIQSDRHFASPRSNLYDRFMSSAVNPLFYPLFVKANAFTVSSACIGCGQCVRPTISPCMTANLSGARTAPTAWHASATALQKPSNTAKRVSANRGIILKHCKETKRQMKARA